jgi:RES domain-containing protein
MIYTSDSLPLAALEVLAHLGGVMPERDFVALELDVPDDQVQIVGSGEGRQLDQAESRRAGGEWAAAMHSLALSVPSVLPAEAASGGRNILINPLHPKMPSVAVVKRTAFRFDPRLIVRSTREP